MEAQRGSVLSPGHTAWCWGGQDLNPVMCSLLFTPPSPRKTRLALTQQAFLVEV